MAIITKAIPVANGTPLDSNTLARAFSQPLDFTTQTSIAYRLATDMTQGIDNVQSIFLDNRFGNAPLYCIIGVTTQVLVCPPYSQGFFPVLFPKGSSFNCTFTSASVVVCNAQFLNFEIDLMIWSVAAPAGAGIQTVQGSVNTLSSPGVWTPRSGVLAAGGTSQLLMGPNGARKDLYLRNPGTANGEAIAGNLEPAYFNFTNAAGVEDGVSFELLPGETFRPGLMVSTEAIYWNAATTGHRLIAREM